MKKVPIEKIKALIDLVEQWETQLPPSFYLQIIAILKS